MTAPESAHPEKIWVSPPKLWIATERMSAEQRQQLLDSIYELAEKHDLVALKKYEFIRIGEYSDIHWD